MNSTAHTDDALQLLLEHHPKELHLPVSLCEYDKLVRQCGAEPTDDTRYLLRMTGLELLNRVCRPTERKIRQAKFSGVQTGDNFDLPA